MAAPAKECCANCNAALREGRTLYCRAHPPTPILYGMGQPAIAIGSPQQQPVVVSHFPMMLDEGWCREWGPRDV